MYKDKNDVASTVYNIVAGLIAGIAIAAVFFAGLVGTILVLVYIALILGAVTIIAVILKILLCGRRQCYCLANSNLLTSAIGAVITSIFALALTTVAAGSIATAILIGAIAYFLVSLIISIFEFLVCYICEKKCCND